MERISAERVMEQASMTAELWMNHAKRKVDENFHGYGDIAKAIIISGYMKAAAGDEIAIHLRDLYDAIHSINP